MWKFDLGIFLTVLSAALPAIMPVLWYQWRNHKQNRDDMKQLTFLLGQYPLHEHGEKKGPLSAEGIRFPKKNGSGLLRGPVDELP